ncbi:MAG: META domain-containing protein [Methylobacteriaceae bacterium]|nr:META domain-containing protein [Methylobacteriaceae bacterium]
MIRIAAGLALAAASAVAPAAAGEVTGHALYRERIALPPGATFVAELVVPGRRGAPARRIAVDGPRPAGAPPFAFRLVYDDAAPGRDAPRVELRLAVRMGDAILFAGPPRLRPLADPRRPLEVLLRRAGADRSATPRGEAGDWRLVELDGAPLGGSGGRTPTLRFGPQGRLTGDGGCNRFSGAWRVAGDRLTIGPLAATMMACPAGMELERRFFDALARVAGQRREPGGLMLLDAAGVALARFVAPPQR